MPHKVQMAVPRYAAREAPVPYKVPMVVLPTAVPLAAVPPTGRMALRLYEARTVALLLLVRPVEQRIVRLFMAVRFMLAPSTGHGSRHPITVPSSLA